VPSVFLSTYTIRVWDSTRRKYVKVNAIDGQKDLLRVFLSYLHDRRQVPSHNTNQLRLLKVSRFNRQGRQCSGTIETGEYGYESDLYDVDQGALSYRRSIADAELLPFHFHVSVPTNTDEALLILQRFGRQGVKGAFEKDFGEYVRSLFSNLRVDIKVLVPGDLLDSYLRRSRIVKVTFVRFGISSDIADNFDFGHEEDEGVVEYQLKAKRGGTFPVLERVQEVLRGRRRVQDFVELRDFEYDDVKLEVDVGGRRRTIALSQPDHLGGYLDITDDVEIGQDGHPTFESFCAQATTYASELMKCMYRDGHHAE